MADEKKPPVSGSTPSSSPSTPSSSGLSPLSPQIKIPPQQPAAPPVGLPTRPTPPMQPSPQPQTAPTLPKPMAPPPPAPVPQVRPEIPTSGSQPVFKSTIRTMQEDIMALKKGQAPTGFQVEKQAEKEIKSQEMAPSTPAGPKIIPPPKPPQIELGKLEKARPLPGAPIPTPAPPRPSPITPPTLKVPETRKGLPMRTGLLIVLGVVIVGGAIVWFFVLRQPGAPEITFTPTPSVTPTATPVIPQRPAIESAFSVFSSVDLAIGGGSIFQKLENTIDKGTLATREPGLYKISEPPMAGVTPAPSFEQRRVNFSAFVSAALIQVPQELIAFIDDKNFYLSLQLKTDGKYSDSFIVKLNNAAGIDAVLKGWESSLSQNLKDVFSLNLTKAESVGFLDNTYQGTAIRYQNFPDPNKTIDYAVVTMPNGNQYLVATNSREHMFAVIDKLLGFVPQ